MPPVSAAYPLSTSSASSTSPSLAEILKKVTRIQIVANRAVNDLFAGQYRSVFRGRGMEFDEVRQYQPGDDVRSIDWNVTARAGEPFIKRFAEERELTVMFLIDVSASGSFGSANQAKLDRVIEIAALLMFAALKNNDKVGMATFGDEVQQFLPPRKGKSHVLHLIRTLLAARPVHRKTCLRTALEFLNRVQKRRAVVFLISDFWADDVRSTLSVTQKRHDVTAIQITDPREAELPNVGFINLFDAETGEVVELDTHHPRVRQEFAAAAGRRQSETDAMLRRAGVDQLHFNTVDDYTHSLRAFFRMREKRFR